MSKRVKLMMIALLSVVSTGGAALLASPSQAQAAVKKGTCPNTYCIKYEIVTGCDFVLNSACTIHYNGVCEGSAVCNAS